MYSATFTYRPGDFDEEFFRLDTAIERVAEGMEGFRGKQSWRSPDGELISSVYYWDTQESIKQFARDPDHLEAKKQYARWYAGYHVLIAKIEHSYGDGKLQALFMEP